MNTYAPLPIKILLTTAAFSVLLFLAIATTILLLQDNVHPDYWKTTKYDIGAGILVAVLYMATTAWQLQNTLKKKASDHQQEHNNAYMDSPHKQ